MTLLPGSLRGRLLVSLLGAIVLTALAQGWTAYRTARAEADQIFDVQMQQMAMSLRPGLHSRLQGGLPGDDDDVGIVLQVWSADGIRVYQSSARAVLPERAVLGFSDVVADGTRYRVFSLQTPQQVIQVAQDMAIRRQMAGTLALRTVAPIALTAPLLMLAAWWAVSASLVPVARVRRQLAQRQADALTPVGEDQLPDEIRPLVRELNGLLGRVRQAFDAQTHFVADAAHELRSPLAALQLQAQALQRAADAPARELAVQRLMAGIARASRLVDQLLALARQQADAAGSVPRQPVMLAALVREEVAEATAAAQASGIDLGLAAADSTAADGAVMGQPEALRVLCRNLLDNALKYTPAPGRVDVSVQLQQGRLLLRVDDSGPGIAPAERSRVLDRFVRLPGQDAAGSGLGLAIVKSIADLHGATLVLDTSPALGGLRAEVSFPAAPAA
jgi:two-component system OmpR family sensor kinase